MLVQPSLLLVVVLSLCGSAAALQCALSTALSGIGEEIAFDSKLTVFGFSASVNYVTLPEGTFVLFEAERPEIF